MKQPHEKPAAQPHHSHVNPHESYKPLVHQDTITSLAQSGDVGAQPRNFFKFITEGKIPLHESCLQLWPHRLCSASTHRAGVGLSFSRRTDRGSGVGGVCSDFKRYLLMSEVQSY